MKLLIYNNFGRLGSEGQVKELGFFFGQVSYIFETMKNRKEGLP